jgi:hypothetical protein
MNLTYTVLITIDNYVLHFSNMKEDKKETWFLPPGYRIYQDLSDSSDYYRFSDQKSNRTTNESFRGLWNCATACHKHYQNKNFIQLLNKNAEIK